MCTHTSHHSATKLGARQRAVCIMHTAPLLKPRLRSLATAAKQHGIEGPSSRCWAKVRQCAAATTRFLACFGRAGAVQRTVSAAHQARNESAAVLSSTPRVSPSPASFPDPGRADVALPASAPARCCAVLVTVKVFTAA